MRRATILATAILAAFLSSAALASQGPEIFNILVENLPSTCTPTRAYTVTDGASDTDCSTGLGSSNVVCMCNDAGTGYDAVVSSSGSISGSGTANTLAMWSSSSGLTDSSATQNAGTGAITIDPIATGANGAFDLIVGGTYGGLEIGNVGIYSSSFSASNLDLDKAILFRQQGNLGVGNDPGIEFAFMEQGNSVRFAIPESGTGNATAMIRSVTIAGPYSSALGNTIVQCATWSDYDSNIDCDTGGSGADLFVQDDLEVQGTIFAHETINLEGATADGNQVILQVGADPGADVTLTLPTSTATIATSAEVDGDISTHASNADAHHGDDIIAEGDSNVEVIDAGTGAINFDVDGSKRGDWDANGLQIDTSTTGYSLDVQGTLDALLRLQSASGSAGITLTTSADTWTVSATGTDFDISDGIYFPFQIEATAPTNTLYLESSGEVGIGTNNPGYELHVATAAGDAAVAGRFTCVDANCQAVNSFENDAQIWNLGTNAADSFQIRDNTGGANVLVLEAGAPAGSLYIDSAGEVGIGNTSPAAPLDVTGAAQADYFAPQDAVYFADRSTAQDLGTTWTTIDWDAATRSDTDYSESAGVITIATAGDYLVQVGCSADNDHASARYHADWRLEQNGVAVPGSLRYSYHRITGDGWDSAHATILVTAAATDTLEWVGQTDDTGTDVQVVADACSIYIERKG